MSDEIHLSVSLPLDSDGFLRRECPTCEREFKWLASTGADEDTEPGPEALFCPYCAVSAPPDAWFTPEQLERAHAVAFDEVIKPALKGLEKSVRNLNRSGMVSAELESDLPDAPAGNAEDDGMVRVDFACHPDEPVKVDEAWDRPVHCLLCGAIAER